MQLSHHNTPHVLRVGAMQDLLKGQKLQGVLTSNEVQEIIKV
jgi:hypothetical protein